jgi:hypothetical protein
MSEAHPTSLAIGDHLAALFGKTVRVGETSACPHAKTAGVK